MSKLIVAVLMMWTAAVLNADQPPPNVVLILADDLGYGDVGCHGATKVRTPHIDRLAREGRRFTDAHSASAACTPSRYALLTGQYAFRIGNYGPIFSSGALLIDPNRTTLASMLKGRGYATACFGKWHLGFGVEVPDWNGELKPGPLEVGFDDYFGVPVVNSHAPFVWVENHRVVGLDPNDPLVFGGVPETTAYPEKKIEHQSMSGARAAHALYKDEEVGVTLAEKATNWLRQQKDRPFFLYLATPQIHHPFTPNPRFKGSSEAGLYGDFIHELDWMVGEVLRTLDELNVAENTLVIFTSDNGGMLNGGGKAAWQAGHRLNGPLLGFKFGAWEGGHRVPFLVRWPGRVPADSVSDQLIGNVDLLATVAAAVGHALGDDDAPDSFNMLPAFTGSPAAPIRDHLILAAWQRTHLSLRSGPWIYIPARGSGGFGNGLAELAFTGQTNSDITRNGKLKPRAPAEQLYNLVSDPAQARNIIAEHPEIARRLKADLEALRTQPRSSRR